ncbi:MAG: RodZ domain-containing protein [Nitrospirota bacterium]
MIGEVLKKKREELGLDLREISNILRIRYDYLKAIEEEDFKKLPAEVYAKGYTLKYAEILKIDPDTVIQAYEKSPELEGTVREERPIASPLERRRSKKVYLMVPLIAVILGIIFFSQIRFIAEEPKQPFFQENKKEPVVARKTQTEVTSGHSPVTGNVSHHVLEILAIDTTWIFATIDDTDSKEVLLKPGESIKWYAKDCFSLKIGNAGGVKLVLDGEEIDKPDEKGQVITIDLPPART